MSDVTAITANPAQAKALAALGKHPCEEVTYRYQAYAFTRHGRLLKETAAWRALLVFLGDRQHDFDPGDARKSWISCRQLDGVKLLFRCFFRIDDDLRWRNEGKFSGTWRKVSNNSLATAWRRCESKRRSCATRCY